MIAYDIPITTFVLRKYPLTSGLVPSRLWGFGTLIPDLAETKERHHERITGWISSPGLRGTLSE